MQPSLALCPSRVGALLGRGYILGKDLGMVGKVRDRRRLFSHRAAVIHGMNHERNAKAFLQSACACQNSHTLAALSGIDQAGDPCPQTRHKTLPDYLTIVGGGAFFHIRPL